MKSLLSERPIWCRDEALWWLIQIPRLLVPGLCIVSALVGGVMVGIVLEAPYAALGAVLIWFCIGIVGMCAIHFIAWIVVASFDAFFFGDRNQ
jgi:hypothetical protein